MHQLTRYCAGWVAAATIATSVSYAAIQNLVVTAALGEPVHSSALTRAVAVSQPIDGPTSTPPVAALVTATGHAVATHSHKPSPTRSTPVRSTRPAPEPTATAVTGPTPAATTTAPAHGYAMAGGQVTLELDATSARLVSAVPAAGYQTETWHTEYWIRVDFYDGDRRSSLIVSWYLHEPTVDVSET
jgi:hypothetical protein